MMKNLLICAGALVCCWLTAFANTGPRPLDSTESNVIYGAGSNCASPSVGDGCVAPCYVQQSVEFDETRRGNHKLEKSNPCIYTTYPPGEDPVDNSCGAYNSSLPCN